jgi:DNA-directed RNA polymerase specialized sigma24 family protein
MDPIRISVDPQSHLEFSFDSMHWRTAGDEESEPRVMPPASWWDSRRGEALVLKVHTIARRVVSGDMALDVAQDVLLRWIQGGVPALLFQDREFTTRHYSLIRRCIRNAFISAHRKESAHKRGGESRLALNVFPASFEPAYIADPLAALSCNEEVKRVIDVAFAINPTLTEVLVAYAINGSVRLALAHCGLPSTQASSYYAFLRKVRSALGLT